MNILNTVDTKKSYEQAKRKVNQICRKKKQVYWKTKLQGRGVHVSIEVKNESL